MTIYKSFVNSTYAEVGYLPISNSCVYCYCNRLIVYSIAYSLPSTVYSLQSTVYSLQSTVYSLQSTVYSLQSTVYSLQSTVLRTTTVDGTQERSNTIHSIVQVSIVIVCVELICCSSRRIKKYLLNFCLQCTAYDTEILVYRMIRTAHNSSIE
jgi:hypothetical protein